MLSAIVVKTDAPVRELVESSVRAGFEPHYAVIRGRWAAVLEALAEFFGFEVYRY